MTKNYVWCTSYLRNHISYDCHLWYLCKMMISPGVFFSCFENFDSLGCWGQEVKKGKKWSKMRKNSVCRAWYFRNHRSYDHHLCYTKVKWLYLEVFFYFFKILIFWVIRRVKGQKWPKMTKTLSFALYISGTIHHMILIYGTHV